MADIDTEDIFKVWDIAKAMGMEILTYYDTSGNHANQHLPWTSRGHFESGPKSQSRVKAGYLLEYYYSSPSHIHTPYGSWTVVGSSSWNSGQKEEMEEKINKAFKLKLLKAGVQNRHGFVGPFYAIEEFRGVTFEDVEWVPEYSWSTYQHHNELWKKYKKSDREDYIFHE
jgi:hypothetical protein